MDDFLDIGDICLFKLYIDLGVKKLRDFYDGSCPSIVVTAYLDEFCDYLNLT